MKSDDVKMVGKQDLELGDFVEDMAESITETDDGKKGGTDRDSSAFNTRKIYYLIFGAAALVAVTVAGFGVIGRKGSPPDPDTSAVLLRIQQLEEKFSRTQGLDGRISALEKEQKQIRQALNETERFGLVLKQQLDKAAEESKSLMAALAKKDPPQETRQTALPEPKKGETGSPLSISEGGRLQHEVKKGESLYRIAVKYGLSVEELCRLNNITPATTIIPGMKMVVRP